jgi:hypothetical protein
MMSRYWSPVVIGETNPVVLVVFEYSLSRSGSPGIMLTFSKVDDDVEQAQVLIFSWTTVMME